MHLLTLAEDHDPVRFEQDRLAGLDPDAGEKVDPAGASRHLDRLGAVVEQEQHPCTVGGDANGGFEVRHVRVGPGQAMVIQDLANDPRDAGLVQPGGDIPAVPGPEPVPGDGRCAGVEVGLIGANDFGARCRPGDSCPTRRNRDADPSDDSRWPGTCP